MFLWTIIWWYVTQLLEIKFIKSILSTIILWISYLIWDFDFALQAMLAAIALDFLLWFSLAVWTGTFSKVKFMSGLKKEMTFVIAIILWNIADYLIFHAQVEWWFQNLFIVYIGVNELLSSLKHLARMWFKTPTKIINRLEKARDNIDIA